MSQHVYRYTFNDAVALSEVGDSLVLAAFSAEGIHGPAQVRLDATFYLDVGKRDCVVDGRNAVGETIARVFTGLLIREFGEEAFTVERLAEMPERELEPAAGGE